MNFNKLKKISPKNQAIYTSTILSILIVLLFLFGIIPAISKIKNLSTKIITEKENIVKKKNKEKDMTKLTKELEEVQPDMKEFKKIFINEQNQLEFITAIEEVAVNNAIQQTINLTPPENIPKDKYTEVPITLTVKGKQANIFSYIKELESLNYQINIDSFVIASQNTSAHNNRDQANDNIEKIELNLNIKATTYWKKYENQN